jgi:hypothetical protein
VHRRVCEQYVDTLIVLHTLDHRALGLDELGGGSNFLARELRKWGSVLRHAQLRPVAAFDRLIEWLHEHVPPSSPGPTLVHGDTKWGNFMFSHDELVALLDWEMTTVGDPLVDLAYSLNYWSTGPGGLAGGMSSDELVARYATGTGIDVPDLAWYENFNTLKLAAIFVRATSLFDRRARDDLRYCWMVLGLPRLVSAALARAGLHDHFDVRDVLPDDSRILEGCIDTLSTAILPELSSEDARTQASYLRVALRYLATSGRTAEVDVRALLAAS